MPKLTPYDKRALIEIHKWKSPTLGFFDHALAIINKPLEVAGDLVFATPLVGDVLKSAMSGLTGVCNDLAQWSVQPEVILSEFRSAKHSVSSLQEVQRLDLEQVDKVVGWLGAKYKALALAEGAGTGFIGLPGIPADLVVLVTLSLRAIGEYATYYGFDVSLQQERLFALNVLGHASSPNDAAKGLAMAQLVRIAEDVAKKRAWQQLEEHAFVQLIQRIASAFTIRLTKAKLAQAVPVLGAGIGAGYNAHFMANVCTAAHHLYRERFLAARYGVEVIEETVKPATDFDPHYAEEPEP